MITVASLKMTAESVDPSKTCLWTLLGGVIFTISRIVDGQACVKNFTDREGVVYSPFFPKNYLDNLNCIYIITQPQEYRITLTFVDFELEANCNFDSLEIHDGPDESSPLLGSKFCGTSTPSPQRTTQNSMWIRFTTDTSHTFKGFNATYKASIIPQEFMLVSAQSSIFRVDIETLSYIRIPAQNSFAIDYDHVANRLYWTDLTGKAIRSAFLNGTNTGLVRALAQTSAPEGIAVDSESRLVFYTDSGNDVIALISMTSLEHKVLITTGLQLPRALALDTMNGIMFWSDWGLMPKIERAGYDGSGRTTLIRVSLIHPNALALDLQMLMSWADKRLYWADAGTNKIECSDMEGRYRRDIFTSSQDTHFFGLAFHKDLLYVTDWTSAGFPTTKSYVHRLKTDGSNVQYQLSSTLRFNDIHIVSNTTFTKGPNSCSFGNAGCSHICIPTPSNISKCLCPDGQSLAADNKSCTADTTYSTPVFSTTAMPITPTCGGNFTNRQGTILSPMYPKNYSDNLNCVYLIVQPTGFRITLTFLDFELEGGSKPICVFDTLEVYDGPDYKSPLIGDKLCGSQMPSVLRTTQNAMWIHFRTDASHVFRGFQAAYNASIIPQEFILVSSQSSVIRLDFETLSYTKIPVQNSIAIDYDHVSSRLYWTDIIDRQIRSAFLNGTDNRLVRDLGQNAVPDGIALDTDSRLIIYTDTGNNVIGLIIMTSLEHKYLVNTGLDQPRAIALDARNGIMFWTDWGLNPKIERALYEGTERKTLISMGLILPNALALDLQNKLMFWADAGTDKVEWSNLDGGNRHQISLLSLKDSHFFGLALHENFLYLTDWTSLGGLTSDSFVHRVHIDGSSAQTKITAKIRLNDIHVYSERTYRQGFNKCMDGNSGCSHICISSPSNASKCLCPDGQSLTADKKTCNASGTVTTSPRSFVTTATASRNVTTTTTTTTTMSFISTAQGTSPSTLKTSTSPTSTKTKIISSTFLPTSPSKSLGPTAKRTTVTSNAPPAVASTSYGSHEMITPQFTAKSPMLTTSVTSGNDEDLAPPTTATFKGSTTSFATNVATKVWSNGQTTTSTVSTPTFQIKTLTSSQSSAHPTTSNSSEASLSPNRGSAFITGPKVFDTNGSRELTLICNTPRDNLENVTYTWNVACVQKPHNRECTFVPNVHWDDKKRVMCTIRTMLSRSESAAFDLELNYPPSSPPVIYGYDDDEILQSGSVLTMTCIVQGGKPLVTSIFFYCLGHSDVKRDIFRKTEAQSILIINPIKASDNGSTCFCSAKWKNSDMYSLKVNVTLRVNDTELTDRPGLHVVTIGAAAAAGAAIIIILIIAVIVFVKRKDKRGGDPQLLKYQSIDNSQTRQLAETDLHCETNVYQELGFSLPRDFQNPCYSSTSGLDSNAGNSDVATSDELPLLKAEH